MAEAAVARPLGEGDLRDQLGLDPVGVARDRMDVGERAVLALELAQPSAEAVERRAVEAGADLARVAQRAVLVVPDQQRAEVGAGALRRREAADHELLLGVALQLQPIARAARAVGAVGTLGDEVLEPVPAGLAEEPLAVLVAVRGQADRAVERERAPEQGLALAKRQVAHVTVLVTEDVEHVEEGWHPLDAAALEALEARDSALEGDDLPVDDEVAAGLAFECLYQLRVLVVHEAVGARE